MANLMDVLPAQGQVKKQCVGRPGHRKNPETISFATIDDVPRLKRLCKKFHRESNLSSIGFSLNRMEHVLRQLISDHSSCVICSRSKDFQIDGFVLGHVGKETFSDETSASDLAFYVHPARRGSLVAYRLWMAFQTWAKEKGATSLWITASSGINEKTADRFFTGLGMERAGSIYRLNIRTYD